MHIILSDESSMQISLPENEFCPMTRLLSSEYISTWKSMSKQSECKLQLGKLFSSTVDNVIKRRQSQNIIICVYKKVENSIVLYLSATTKDNSIILAEFTIIQSDFLYGSMKYRSQNKGREVFFENFISMIMSDANDDESEDVICR